jgi:hypothetical protein
MAETIFSSPTKNLSFEQLAAVRKRTHVISDFLEKQLLSYLDTLRSLLLPERILGKLVGSKFDVPGADKTLTELQESYRRLPGKPFDFSKEFETDWLSEVGVKLELQRWEYSREIATESEKRTVAFTSPTRWIVGYGPGLSFAQAIQAFSRKQDRRGNDQLRQFVVNTLVFNSLIARSGGIIALLNDLRYKVQLETHPSLSGLPLAVVQSQVSTFLPPEPVIAAATELSGINAFIELIDLDAIRELRDPFLERIAQLVPGQI